MVAQLKTFGDFDTHFNKDTDEITADGVLTVSKEGREKAKYPEFLPQWDPNQKFPPLKFFKHEDPGLRADPGFPNLLPKDGTQKVQRVTPKLGTEITGVQLSQLDDRGKD